MSVSKFDVSFPLDRLAADMQGGLSLDNLGTLGSELALWPIQALRGADPIMGLAVLMIVALLAGEAVHRMTRLPRALGAMLVGALASPLALSLVARAELDPWKPLLDLAVGLLVFELGSRIRPRWLIDNPWLTVKCLAEALVTGVAVTAVLV
ncbi:MAG: hypothetical protein RL260_526, partial [Pseudomonadota bacterium]